MAIEHTGANVHDSEMAIALVDGIPPIKQPRGRPRKRPDEVLADRAYDAEEVPRGEPLAPEVIEEATRFSCSVTSCIGDVRSSARYRERVTEVLMRRLLEEAATAGVGERLE